MGSLQKDLNLMKSGKFYRTGTFIYRFRWAIILLWLGIIFACLPLIPQIITPFKTTGFVDEKSQSVLSEQFLDKKLGYNKYNKFIIIYTSKTLSATEPLYIQKIKYSLSGLKDFPLKHTVFLPDSNKKRIAKDKHSSYVVVSLKTSEPINDEQLKKFKTAIKTPKNMTVSIGGEPIFEEDVSKQTQTDLYNADFIVAPLTLITLLLVFGSVCAAVLPVLLGGGCALIILTTLSLIAHTTTLSIFTLNIALLLGLCLSLDYSLFIISRFRDELHKGYTVDHAIAITQQTAGKAVFFSGLAVFTSLSALLLFPINILFSVAIGGITAVTMAVLTAILLLPAFLSVLGKNINFLTLFKKNRALNKASDQSIQSQISTNYAKHEAALQSCESKTAAAFHHHHHHHDESSTFWRWLAKKVVKRPPMYFCFILLILLALGAPFLTAQFGVSDFRIFPEKSVHRSFFDTFAKQFDERDLTPIVLVVKTYKGNILSRSSIGKLFDLSRKLDDKLGVTKINSIVTVDSKMTKDQYHMLYHSDKDRMPEEVKNLLATTTGKKFTVINISTSYPPNSQQMKDLVSNLENTKAPDGMTMELTGTPVKNIELLEKIASILPYAVLWIVVSTYVILLLLLRSLFLPVKAILTTMLSLVACYGALVLVFQNGFLHHYLNFQPQGMLDISLLVIIFCALFGFSMDYEVFLLSRIKEYYDLHGDNKQSIIFGIEKSSRIITCAAIIVIFICSAFLIADVLLVKAFGLGIAVAIFVDAFLIRTLLVPAVMTIMGRWNWYLPKWMDRILPKL